RTRTAACSSCRPDAARVPVCAAGQIRSAAFCRAARASARNGEARRQAREPGGSRNLFFSNALVSGPNSHRGSVMVLHDARRNRVAPLDKPPLYKRILSALGPGLVTGASDDDPSGIGTYSQAGAQFGFGICWTMLFSYP